MKKAADKYDLIQQDVLRQQKLVDTAREDPIMDLKAKIKAQKRVITKMHKQSKKNSSGGGSNGGDKSGGKDGKKKKKKGWKPFPDELKDHPTPSDPSKPHVIDDKEYWYCTHHKKWGRHSSDECTKGKDGDDKTDGKKEGDRKGRVVKAYEAIIKGAKR